jgi:hypothetical protein
MNKKIMWKIVMVLIVITLFSNLVLALGVAPAKVGINFEANLEKEIILRIFNEQNKDFKAVVYARGELAEYLNVDNTLISVKADQSEVEFKFKINLPDKFDKPGVHEAEIVIMEFEDEFATNEENVAVTALAAVVSKLQVRVPYPGKYAESRVHIESAMIGENVVFIIPIFNFGKENIENARARVEIFGPTYEKLGEFYTNDISINARGEGKVRGSWKADVNAGIYHAVVTIEYDGKKERIETNFEVGNKYVNIKEVNVADFNLGEVAKFDIVIENMWNQLLKDVYGELIVLDKEGTEYTRFKTATIDLEPYGSGLLEAYWSTKNIPIGQYDLDLTIFYEGKESHKLIEANVNIDSIKTDSFIVGQVISGKEKIGRDTLLLFVVFMLIIINISWFIYLKRRHY